MTDLFDRFKTALAHPGTAVLSLSLLLLSAGCTSENEPERTEAVARDSAGIRIVDAPRIPRPNG